MGETYLMETGRDTYMRRVPENESMLLFTQDIHQKASFICLSFSRNKSHNEAWSRADDESAIEGEQQNVHALLLPLYDANAMCITRYM